MSRSFHFGYTAEYLVVFRETFQGDGVTKTFQLDGDVGNATFTQGAWDVTQVEPTMPSHVTTTAKGTLYDGTNVLTRNKIGVSSINSSGLVTLDYAPQNLEYFYIWYWFDLEGELLTDYYREDFVASMEGEAGVAIASEIATDTTSFNGILSSADDTVQKALDTLDDISLDHGDLTGLTDDDHPQYPHKVGWDEAVTTQITLSFDAGTRTVTVAPTGASFSYWAAGVQYTKSEPQTVTITDTEGIWYIYFLGATLTASQTIWSFIIQTQALVALLYWDAANNVAVVFDWEAHGWRMDRATHAYLHQTIGTRWESGLGVSINSANLDIASGYIHDEDIRIYIEDSAAGGLWQQDLTPASLPILYRTGAAGLWRKVTASTTPVYLDTNVPQVNIYDAGEWKWDPVDVNRYFVYWVIASCDISEPVFLVPGQEESDSLTTTRDGNTLADMSFGSLPAAEHKVLARVILQRSNAAPYYTLIELQDYRQVSDVPSSGTAFAGDHGALIGLGDDDHTQYLLAAGTRELSAAWDAGPWQIRAETFQSDIATGAAPFTVASTTLVSNLNADLLDGQEGSYYVPVTLDANADNLLSLTTQELGLDTQAANVVFAGPAAGAAAVPTFRALVAADIPTLDHGGLDGRSDDDHTQYLLVAGTRGLSANWNAGAYNITAANLIATSIVYVGVNDTTAGNLYLYGAAETFGGSFALYTAADNDDTINYYNFGVVNDYFRIATGGGTSYFEVLASGDVKIPAGSLLLPASEYINFNVTLGADSYGFRDNAGKVEAKNSGGTWVEIATDPPTYTTVKLTGLGDGKIPYHVDDATGLADSVLSQSGTVITLAGSLRVGTDDTTVGDIYLYGGGVGADGGVLRLYLGADDDATIAYFGVQIVEDDLLIGPDTDTDALKLLNDGKFYITNGSVYIQSAGSTKIFLDYNGSVRVGEDDTSYGSLLLYGQGAASTQGGLISLYLAADHDASMSAFSIQVIEDDLLIGPSTDTDALKLDAAKDLYLTDGDAYIQTGGTTKIALDAANALVKIGVDDTTVGTIYLYGGGEGADGGVMRLYLGADDDATINYYGMQVVEDDLVIGPDTDPDAIKLAGNQLYVTNGSLYVQHGGTTRLLMNVGAQTADLTIGQNDTVAGSIGLYGHAAGSTKGGLFQLYLAADHDGTIDYFNFAAVEDDLLIGPDTDTDALKLDSNKDLYITAGSLVLPASEYINLGGTLGSDGYGFRDNAGTMEFKHSGDEWTEIGAGGDGGQGHVYVDRGDKATGYDFTEADLTLDATWRDIDFSSVVPVGAVAVVMWVAGRASAATRVFQFRKKGNAGAVIVAPLRTQVANQYCDMDSVLVPLDGDRKAQYNGHADLTNVLINVRGWFIPSSIAGYVEGGHLYRSRTSPVTQAIDFTLAADLTTDGTWRTLDLSSILPEGAVAANIWVYAVDDAAGSLFMMRPYGVSDAGGYAQPHLRTQVVDKGLDGTFLLGVSTDRKIEYYATNTTWSQIYVSVVGWLIPGAEGLFAWAQDGTTLYHASGDVEIQSGNLELTGNLTFSGTGRRITGDMSNATESNRLSFQTSTADGTTVVTAIPNGTSTASYFALTNSASVTNCGFGYIGIATSAFLIASTKLGTGTYLPMIFYTGGAERMRIGKDYGNVSIGYAGESSDIRLTVLSQGTTSSYYDVWTGTSAGTVNFYSRSDGLVYARVGYGAAGVIATNVNFYSRSSTSNDSSYACIWQNSGGNNLMYVAGNGGSWVHTAWAVSGRDTKENIKDVVREQSLAKVLSLQPKSFDYIDGEKGCLGFVAEEVELAIPEMVSVGVRTFKQDENNNAVPETYIKGLAYNYLFPHLVNVTKDHQDMIDSLSSRVEDLEAQVLFLMAELAKMTELAKKVGGPP